MPKIIARIVTEVSVDDDGSLAHSITVEPVSAQALVTPDKAALRAALLDMDLNPYERFFLFVLAGVGPVSPEDFKAPDKFGAHPHPGQKLGNTRSGLTRRFESRGLTAPVTYDEKDGVYRITGEAAEVFSDLVKEGVIEVPPYTDLA